VLNKRERHIVTERWLKEAPTKLDDLATQYSVSRERVRQIEVRALTKLQKAMKARMVARIARTGPVTAGTSAATA